MSIEEATLLLEHTGYDDFNLLEHQAKGRTKAIQVILKENQKLKKQIKKWNFHLNNAKELLEIQGEDGNYNYDNYMLGLYNGMEHIISLFETRNPIFKDGKDIEFLSDKTQQKEFIEYLENEKDRLARETSHIYEDEIGKVRLVNEDVFNEIIQNLKANKTDGYTNFCEISEEMLNAIKELSRREHEENKKYKEVIDKAISLLDNYQNNLYSKKEREGLDDDIEISLKILKEVE